MGHELEALQVRLGRVLSTTDRRSIEHLNQVPEALIGEARSLRNRLMAERLLRYYTGEPLSVLRIFVDQVVFGGQAASEWQRGRVLVPSLSLAEQLCREPHEILAAFPEAPDQVIIPDFDRWSEGLGSVGAPALVQPEADYRSPVPPETMGLAKAATAAITNLQIAVRRWIATRLAMVLFRSGELDLVGSPKDIRADLPAWKEWSDSARIAAAALLRERRELVRIPEEVPGFRGEDAWYGR